MQLSRDLQSKAAIVTKGFLFIFLGLLAAIALLIEYFSWPHLLLLVIAIWSFCRAYYFAFYVIEKYVDSRFRYSGLCNFLCHLFRKPREPEQRSEDSSAL